MIETTYKVSVIVPIFNVGKYLSDCLYSLGRQTIGIENIQVICVNDKSPLEKQEKAIFQYWFERYPKNFLILNNSENLGLGMSRNKGVKFAKGEYVHFLDADDMVEPTLYALAYRHLKKTRSQVFRINYRRGFSRKYKHYPGNASKEGLMDGSDKTRALFYSYAWLNVVENRLLRTMKRFPRGIYEDIPSTPTLFHSAYSRYYQTKQVLYYYRENPTSITGKITRKDLEWRDNIKIQYLYSVLLDFVDKKYFPLDYGMLVAQYFLVFMISSSRETLQSFQNTMSTLKVWIEQAPSSTRIRLHPDTVKDYGRFIAVGNSCLLLLWKLNFFYTLFFFRKFLGLLKKIFHT